jgi:hypothetical protein
LSVVAHFAPKGSPDSAIGPPDLAIPLEQGIMDGGSEPGTLNGETTHISGDPTKGTEIKQHLTSQQHCRSSGPSLHTAEILGFRSIWPNSFLPLKGVPRDWHFALRSGLTNLLYHTWIAPSTILSLVTLPLKSNTLEPFVTAKI